MSALNPTIITSKNPSSPANEIKEICITEKIESQVEIPAQLLQRAIQACDTKTELVVYITILRFALGFNRDRCTVSRRFIAKWTGLQFQNVGRGIEGLITKGLIEKVPEANANHGDVFKVLHFTETPMTRNQNDYTQTPRCNQPENTSGVINVITECHQTDYAQTPGCNQLENTSGVINVITECNQTDYTQAPRCNQLDYEVSSKRLQGVIKVITKNKIEDLEESSSISEGLETYLRGIQMLHMQKIERSCVEKLLKEHSNEEIERALKHVQAHGTVGDGAICKLPLSYLAKSISRVLQIADEARHTEQAKMQLLSLNEKRKVLAAENLIQSERNEREAQEAFLDAFPDPDERDRIVTQIVQTKFKLLSPSGKIARKIATLHWFKNFRKNSPSEGSGK